MTSNLDSALQRLQAQVDALTLELDASKMQLARLGEKTGVADTVAASPALQATERKARELNEELAKQVEVYVLTESLARVGHWIMERGASTLHWSAGLYDVTSVDREQGISSAEARERIHPDDLATFLAARERMDGRIVEYRWKHPDERTHWMRSRMERRYRSDGSYLDIGVVQDITEEYEAKFALQEQLAKLRLLTSRLPEMVFQFETEGPARGRFRFVSDAVTEIFGVTVEQVIENPNTLFQAVHADDVGAMLRSMNASAQDGSTWAHEFRSLRPDGAVRTLFGKSVSVKETDTLLVAYGAVIDVTEHRASQVSLRESEERFRSLTELSSDWFWEQDENFRFVRQDGAMVRLAGNQGTASLGKTRWEIGALNMKASDWAAHKAVLESHAVFRDLELNDVDLEGQPYWVSISGVPMCDVDGKFKGYRGVGHNITARKLADAKIERLAFYDVLTGLPNRRMLIDRLQIALAASARDRGAGALLFIDLDNFKDLNDSQGHDVGDLLLRQVASRLLECVREVDTVARLGGDEFVVMLQSLGDDIVLATAQAGMVGLKILTALNQSYQLGTFEYFSTPSVGITLFQDQTSTVDELLKQADLAMYESKAAGRNTMRFFDPAMQIIVAQRTALEAQLRQGIKRDELLLYYQPVVDVSSRVVGVEALVRWQHPERGLVPPDVFISIAEQSGLILPLGEWVLRTACNQLAAWARSESTARLTMAVNVSARQFRHPDFVQSVKDTLADSGARADLLKLELTESLLLNDAQEAVGKMTDLRTCGVHFSLDDFGTGYSSLAYLKLLPLEHLKIDKSFVRDVLNDANDAAIARTVLALGKSLGLGVVAEGVETPGQQEFLLQNGCTLFQGYLFGKPGPVADLRL